MKEVCHCCGRKVWCHQTSVCPECNATICDLPGCDHHCKCDLLPNAEDLLTSVEFRRLYCFCSNPLRCEGCFLTAKSVLQFTKNHEGRFVYVSNGFQTLLGLRASEMLGRTVEEVFPDYIAESMHASDVAARNGLVDTRVVRKITADGDHVICLVRKYVLPNGFINSMALDLSEFLKLHPYNPDNPYNRLHRVVAMTTKLGFSVYSQVPI
jgi:PAS domain S-box-containing protein